MRTVTLRETEAPFGLVLEMHCWFDLADWETSQDQFPSGGRKWPPWRTVPEKQLLSMIGACILYLLGQTVHISLKRK